MTKEKRKRKEELCGYVRKVCSIVSEGPTVVACVFHVLSDDNTGEFDPYGIERVKNCMQMMRMKGFPEAVEAEINQMHTFKF